MKKLKYFIGIAFLLFVFSCTQDKKNIINMQSVDIDAEKAEFEHLKPEYKAPEVNPQSEVKPRIAPPHWWADMEEPTVELMIHGDKIGSGRLSIDYPGVRVENVTPVENPNYLFVKLDIRNAKPGKFPIIVYKGSSAAFYEFEIKERTTNTSQTLKTTSAAARLTPADVIYLIMPDRFANGDPTNDSVQGMSESTLDRNKVLSRHGGDIQGIINHLDYLKDLGVTALWLNPVQENNEPYESYHGYAITDHYAIDPRLGDTALYKKLVEEAHKRGLKVIMDVIQNHAGHNHYFVNDLPTSDWLNSWEEFTRTTYRAPALMDPYAAEADKKQMSDGWFDNHMPDLNQRNPHLARYLIQNTIWWVEETGLDGFRIDTYAYPDVQFSKDWMSQLLTEYPDLGVFGETWVHGIPIQNYFIEQTGVPAVTDFQLYYAITDALNNEQGWTDGVAKIYYTLAQDGEYAEPWKNVVFLDNHDLARFRNVVNGDLAKWKQGVAWLLTTRGIPMLTYGTEHFMGGEGGGFGEGGRKDFPGGWENDAVNKFDSANLEGEEKETFEYLSKLLQFRKNAPALTGGSLKQFVPQDGVYVYFRISDEQTILVVMNGSDSAKSLNLERFSEVKPVGSSATDIMTGESIGTVSELELLPRETLILEVEKP